MSNEWARKLDLLNYFALELTGFNNKVIRVINVGKQLDFRRSITLSCLLSELYSNLSYLSSVILDGKQLSDIIEFIKKCLDPLFILSEEQCTFHDLFVDTLFINSSRTVDEINTVLKSPVRNEEFVSKLFNFLSLFVEEVYISLVSINVSCNLFKNKCSCSEDECSCNDRDESLTLFYSDCYDPLHIMIYKYLDLAKKYFEPKTIVFKIDFKYLERPVKLDEEAVKALNEAFSFFKDVSLLNTRVEKVILSDTERKQLTKILSERS